MNINKIGEEDAKIIEKANKNSWKNWKEKLDIEHPYPKGDFLLSKPDKIWRSDVIAFIEILFDKKREEMFEQIESQIDFGIREKVIIKTLLRGILK